MNPLLEEYEHLLQRPPIEQPTLAQAGQLHGRAGGVEPGAQLRAGLGAHRRGPRSRSTTPPGAISAPLTGVNGVGSSYGGIQSGWTSVPAAFEQLLGPDEHGRWLPKLRRDDEPGRQRPSRPGKARASRRPARAAPAPTVQWQVSTDAGVSFANDTTDAGNTTGTLTVAATTTAMSGRQYRAVFTNARRFGDEHRCGADRERQDRSSEGHHEPRLKDRHGRGKRELHGGRLGRTRADGAVAGLHERRGHVLKRHDGRRQHHGNADGREHHHRAQRAALPGRVHELAGSATSAAATLTVNAKTEAPKVTTNPASKVGHGRHEAATFTAAASGLPAPKVQWQVSTNNGVTFSNDTTDAGNATTTLTVANTTTTLSGRRLPSGLHESVGSATSAAATLTVTAALPVLPSVPVSRARARRTRS